MRSRLFKHITPIIATARSTKNRVQGRPPAKQTFQKM